MKTKALMTGAMLAILLAVFSAHAGNDSCNNRCGEEGGTTNAPVANGGSGYGGSGGNGTGVGLGGEGGQGGAGGRGGDGGNALAAGGDGGSVYGSGNSHNLNKNDNTNLNNAAAISGSKSDAESASLSNAVSGSKSGATANNGGNTLTGGPTTVGGQAATNNTAVTVKSERNAPPVFLGAITPTSCGGSFNAGGSSRDGAGGLGFSWVGTECAIRQLGDRYQQMGQVDVACNLYSSTKAFKKAAKRNPKLRDLDCTVKPAVVAPVIPQAFLEARTPRG